MKCPRCSGNILKMSDELICVQCGYEVAASNRVLISAISSLVRAPINQNLAILKS
jgi:hypothetical protein